MQQINLRRLLTLCCLGILCSFFSIPITYSNNPCTAYVFDFEGGGRDTVPCGRIATTIRDIDVDAAGTTDFQLKEDCESLLPAPHDYVTWFTFVIPAGGSFEWQIIETGRDDVNYEIYYTNEPTANNECEDLTYYTCGDHFITWERLGVPDPNKTTRFYVAMFTEKEDDDVTVNIKFRKSCNEGCNNSDMAVVAAEDRCIDLGQSTILEASPSGGGSSNYTYLWSPNDGSIDNIHSPIPTVSPTETTTYTVQVRGDDDCFAYDEVTVLVGACCLMPPVLECPPRYVGCPGSSLDPYITGTPTAQVAEDGCSDVKFTYEDVILNEDPACPGAMKINRIWTASYYDFPDLQTTCEQRIVLKDKVAPVLHFDDIRLQDIVSGDTIRVECDTILPFSQMSVTAIDNCDDDVTVEFDDFLTQEGDCLIDRFNLMMDCRWSATDACGNTTDFQIIVIIEDTTPPVFTWSPPDLTTTCDAIPPVETPEIFENCTQDIDLQFSETNDADECAGSYTILRTWTATDVCENVATLTQTITVQDEEAPILYSIPGDIRVSCDDIPPASTNITASDNCGNEVEITLSETITNGNCVGNYTITRQWTGIDACGNQVTESQIVTVEDNRAPVLLNVPDDADVSCDNIPDADVVSAVDNCDAEVSVALNESIQQISDCEYKISRKWTATDDCGNHSFDIQILTVTDDSAPVLVNVPADAAVSCDNIPDADAVSAVDNCDDDVAVVFTESTQQINACEYKLSRKWTAADDCGNSTAEVQVLTVTDNTAPVLVDVPADATVSCENVPDADLVSAIDNCDNDVTVVFSESTQQINACEYKISRKWTATDDCGNSTAEVQVLTVIDNTKPVLVNVPADADVSCDNIPDADVVSAVDNCDNDVAVSFTETTQTISDCEYRISRKWTATDDCGNFSFEVQTLTVKDDTAPVLVNVPADAAVSCDNIPDADVVSAVDNCDNDVSISFNESTQQISDCEYKISRKWTATDDCGNSTFDVQIVTVTDDTAPILQNVPVDMSASCTNIPDADVVTATDNCDNNVAVTYNETIQEGSCGGNYTLIRKWTATDDCGNQSTATQTVTVTDNTPPTIEQVPDNVTVACGEVPSPASVFAIDDCDDQVDLVLKETIVELACAGKYNLRRKWTATDACGNQSTALQVIKVRDNEKPILYGVPADVEVNCSETPPVANVTASDACDNEVTIEFTEEIQARNCGDKLIRKWTAIDACGNKATATQEIRRKDTTEPVFQNVPADATVSCGEVPSPNIVTATDDCDSDVEITFTETLVPLSCAGKYNLRRKWVAIDNCGNRSVAQQLLKVRDNEKPVLNGVPADATVSCGVSPQVPNVTATDACDDNVTVEFSEEIQTRNCGDKLIRKWTAIDACGNKVTATQKINRTDDAGPVLYNIPENITVECDAIPAIANVTATDDCSGNVSVTYSETINPKNCAGDYNIRRKWSAIDACGNTTNALQVVKVRDNTPPVLVGVPNDVNENCGGTSYPPTVTATDNCDDTVSVIFEEETVNGACGGDIIRKWTATDNCGNTTSKTQRISQNDTQNPVLVGVPNSTTVSCDNIPAVATVTATDNCDNDVTIDFNESVQQGACAGESTISRKWSATDDCGNHVFDIQIITVVDNIPPVLNGVPTDSNGACGGGDFFPPTVTASDNCDPNVQVIFGEEIVDGDCGDDLIRKWTATDACGNRTTKTQRVSLSDNQDPVLQGVPASITVSCENIPAAPTVTATDNCDDNVEIYFNESTYTGNCIGEKTITRRWTAQDDCGNQDIKIQQITVVDNQAPSFWDCPYDITVQANQNCQAQVTWNAITATDNCGGNVTITSSHPNGGNFTSGTTTVTYTATDACGNVAYCTFEVTVEGASFGIDCPDDLWVNCENDQGAYVTWTPPTGTSCCNACSPNTEVPNFLYMGTYGGHRYYCSNEKSTWHNAQAVAQSMGGHLAVINDAGENQYLTGFLQNQHAFIGLTDEGTEGNFRWVNGDPVTYTNWRADQPNNNENNQHYGQLLNTGKWNDTYGHDQLEYIVEIPCIDIRQIAGPANGSNLPVGTTTITYQMQDDCGNTDQCSFTVTVEENLTINCPEDVVIECDESGTGAVANWTPPTLSGCCSDCPQNTEIQGFMYMGTRNGHRYYCSLDKTNWSTAQANCASRGGHLAVINDADENAFLTSFLITQRAFIGLTDQGTEGNFRWVNGDPLTYTNWYPNEPDNDNNAQHYVELMNTGQWNDTYGTYVREYIMEIPCNDPIQIGGPAMGTVFPAGTSTVTYQAQDNCGNTAICSFEVTVENCNTPDPSGDYCDMQGNSTAHVFIHKVNTSAFSNASSNNGGYADFTGMVTNMNAGSAQSIVVYPGFYNQRRYVYWTGWIDYNHDGDFKDEGEKFFAYKHYQGLRINFTVPPHATLGATRMRIAMSAEAYPVCCEDINYGEVEDYTVNILGQGRTAPIQVVERTETNVEILDDTTDFEGLNHAALTVQVYPNPVKDYLTVSFELPDFQTANLKVINHLGQLVTTRTMDCDYCETTLELSDLASGIYYVLVNGTSGETVVKRIVVE